MQSKAQMSLFKEQCVNFQFIYICACVYLWVCVLVYLQTFAAQTSMEKCVLCSAAMLCVYDPSLRLVCLLTEAPVSPRKILLQKYSFGS